MELEVDDGRAGELRAEAGGQLEGGLGEAQVFAMVPDAPLRPVPGVADLEGRDERGEATEDLLEEGAPGAGVEDVGAALEKRENDIDAAGAEAADEGLAGGEVAVPALPGGDADEGARSAGLAEQVEDRGVADRRPEGARPGTEPGTGAGETAQPKAPGGMATGSR